MSGLDEERWDDQADVIVVGFGAAGASTALEASQQGASVLALDRFHGGGSTATSGGVIYAGGGTPLQLQAGCPDSPDEMFNYLRQETGGVVLDETLRRFCDESPRMIAWLEQAGVLFDGTLCPFKTSYPKDGYYLYYSGNENCPPYRDHAKSAPRGHRPKGKGLSGQALFRALESAAQRQVIRVRAQTEVRGLIQAADGRVIGVEGRTLSNPLARRIHAALSRLSVTWSTYDLAFHGREMNALLSLIMAAFSKPYRARARKGVILCAGGFAFNRAMVVQRNPAFKSCIPLGTFGDDGAGIALGESVGGATARLDRMTAWRFFVPPEALLKGVLLDGRGGRLCNEELYGAKQGDYIVAAGGVAWLVFDRVTYQEAVRQIGRQCAPFQRLVMIPTLYLLRKKASTYRSLAKKIGLPPGALEDTMGAYNSMARQGASDPLGKNPQRCVPQDRPPFYALDDSIKARMGIPTASLTLGGLVVDEQQGSVLGKDRLPIEGLYAAGRNALGLCSNGYFASGISLADCVFSGRRAGYHAAIGSPGNGSK